MLKLSNSTKLKTRTTISVAVSELGVSELEALDPEDMVGLEVMEVMEVDTVLDMVDMVMDMVMGMVLDLAQEDMGLEVMEVDTVVLDLAQVDMGLEVMEVDTVVLDLEDMEMEMEMDMVVLDLDTALDLGMVLDGADIKIYDELGRKYAICLDCISTFLSSK